MTTKAPGSTVLRMVQNAMNILNIEVETGWDVEDIKALAKDEGFYLNPSTSRFLRSTAPVQTPRPEPQTDDGAEVRESASQPLVVPAPSSPATPELTVVEDIPDEPIERVTVLDPAGLIAAGTDHWDESVAEAAREAKAWLDILAEGLVQAEHRAVALAEVEHLEQLLHAARLKAGLVEIEAPAETPSYDAKTVRAWAAANGVDCPRTGRVPRHVVDAYLDAHEAGAA